MRSTAIMSLTLAWMLAVSHPSRAGEADPVFDLEAIAHDPLDATVLKSSEKNGIVTEEIEYTAEVRDGKAIRIFGILSYPAGGKTLPGMFWSQSGMAPAGPGIPQLYAKKGYLCLNVTLPHNVYDSFARYTVEDPRNGNLARLAVAQMRGITYMTQRQEVDADRIGVGGSSYGGVFATLIAGADPRVKAGFSFFCSGNHHLGTNFPQFTLQRSLEDVDRWLETIDPAQRHKRRAVPFLFAVASNDNWQYFPAAVQSYVDAIGDKRLVIAPNWMHGFPEGIDNTLFDWMDIHLARTLPPYNQPSAVTLQATESGLTAKWNWTGDNAVTRAELIVSYGNARPWHGSWTHRYHHVLPAIIDGKSASAIVPVPELDLPCIIYGNITDDRGHTVSTTPLETTARQAGIAKADASLSFNTARMTDCTPAEMDFLTRHGEKPAGEIDAAEKHAGGTSLREKGGARFQMRLNHVPQRSHTLSVHLKSSAPTTLSISVKAAAPANWQHPVVDALRRRQPGSPDIAFDQIHPPTFELAAEVTDQWQRFELPCPYDEATPVEGYSLSITPASATDATWWIDTISFAPQWRR